MAQYDVTYSCGCTGMVNLFGPGKERGRKIEWMRRSGLCPDCYKAEKRAEGPKFYVRQGQRGIELACYANSYDIKDDLKARGYRFTQGAPKPPSNDLMRSIMHPTAPGWVKLIAEYDHEALYVEAIWIEQNGWPLALSTVAGNLISALAEGRPDLIPEDRSTG